MSDGIKCKNCEDDISPRSVYVGGPLGAIRDGWLHDVSGIVACDGNVGVAVPN